MNRFVRLRCSVLLAFVLVVGLAPVLDATAQGQDRRRAPIRRGYLHPQIDRTGSASVVVLWARPVTEGHDLLLARREASGALTDPRRLDVEASDLGWGAEEWQAPVLVAGTADEVGVVWTGVDGHLWVSTSIDGARTMTAPRRIDAQGRAIGSIGAAFDRNASLHVVWAAIDSDDASKSSLRHATVTQTGVSEATSLSADLTICPEVRPALRLHRGEMEVYFRSVSVKGHERIQRVTGDVLGDFGAPMAYGPELEVDRACAATGLLDVGHAVMWIQRSDRPIQVLLAASPTAPLIRALGSEEITANAATPRRVAGTGDESTLVLVPGDPEGMLLQREGGRWTVVLREIPAWCSSAVLLDDQLLMMGDEYGQLRTEAVDARW